MKFRLEQLAKITRRSEADLALQFREARIVPVNEKYRLRDLFHARESELWRDLWEVAAEFPCVFTRPRAGTFAEIEKMVSIYRFFSPVGWRADLKISGGLGMAYFSQADQFKIELSDFEIQRGIKLIGDISDAAAARFRDFESANPDVVAELLNRAEGVAAPTVTLH